MDIYKKAYAQLVGKVDNAITALDEVIRNPLCTNITECAYIRGRLVSPLLEAEELIVSSMDSGALNLVPMCQSCTCKRVYYLSPGKVT